MHPSRPLAVASLLLFAAAACRAVPVELFVGVDETVAPEPTSTAKTLCQSGADLRTDIESLRSLDVSEDGVLQLIVSADAALGEARTLALLAGQEYGPLVTDVVVSLQDVRDIGQALERQDTIGASIAVIGEAITAVGDSMDALTLALREPCPEE